MQKIVPNIWCNRNAEEAGVFYASVFPGATSRVESRYPSEGLLDFQRDFAGEPLTVNVEIEGTRLVLINAGDEFHPNPSISLVLNFDPLMFGGDAEVAIAQMNSIWGALSDGGTELMPIGEYPFSPRYGWVQDRYGVSWQLMLTNPEGDPRPFIIPALMFGGAAQNRAAEALDLYTAVFEDAAIGNRFPYGQQTGPATPDALMFSEFRIGEQWFGAMDSGVEQDFSFTCGVSLEVSCADQHEIDRLWDALSAVPEAEQCGWLADRFGVSWQIVPANMKELMDHPNAFEHLMEMKKIVIADI
ncbi:VOC family protein [Lysinibacter sp. HNR]|uniref:VOC family protein n=1 Tax=Lysinibacter sp. HNR TaxID=3031408 RepID=UPI0024357F85|nr:VOC family protein [Lysinibacter sp. HNR]WGD36538.1 VOC family protein [Lysinibacter sp. HNR]